MMSASPKKRVHLSYGNSEFILRQTPGRSGQWGDWLFDANILDGDAPATEYAGVAVYERLGQPLKLRCDPARTLFVTGEPETIRTYHPDFLAQFAAVLTSRSDLQHPNVVRSQPAIPWWAGVRCSYPHKTEATRGYDEFAALQTVPPAKPKGLSIVCSTKAMTEGHRKRLVLLDRLIAHFGDRLDVFGHGFREVEDKWDAIAPYRYHLAIENSSFPHYWTEKIADAYLGCAFPLYWGCPNLSDYFPSRSFERLERDDASAAIDTIERVLGEDVALTRGDAMREARRRLLDEHNVFPAVIRIFENQQPASPKRLVIRPESDFTDSTFRVVGRGVKRRLRKLMGA